MGTRSRIAVQRDGNFESIYCHWDGYLSHNGKILVEHYTDPAKVDALLALGDCSSLRQHVRPVTDEPHTFDAPIDDVTSAYADRGESCPSEVSDDLNALLKLADNCGTEYLYVFHAGVWLATWHGEFRAFGCGPGDDDEPSPWLPLHVVETALADKADEA